MKRYKIISEELIKNVIEFLDEIQFDAAKINTTESHHQVNFCTWAITELLNSYNIIYTKNKKKKPKQKTRNDYIDETFLDWNLPEMSDEEFEKLVDTFDNFIRAWEKEYLKSNPKKKIKRKPRKPRFEDLVQHCSLDEIRDMLLDDPELTPSERFDLYYTEHERVNKKKEKTYGYCHIIGNLSRPREFCIELDADTKFDMKQLLTWLAHEFVHLRQFFRMELYDYVDGTTQWKTKRYKINSKSDLEAPWEKEAYRLESKLADEFVERYYE